MDESGEDHISNLPDDVVCHILSCLPTKDAVLTSILSKDWENKWTSVYNIQLDDRKTSLRGKTKNRTFVNFVERVLKLTENQRIKSFCLFCSTKLEPDYLKTCINSVLQHGVQNLEINAYRCGGNPFADALYNCRSLTELKLTTKCILYTSRMKDCFPNLKILYLCQGVKLLNNEDSNTRKVSLNFPVLEELEFRRCVWWWNVDSVDINAPALIRFLGEGKQTKGIHWLKDRVIKINGAKLQKFESCGGLVDNFVVTTPSVSKAVLTNFDADPILEIRAHATLKGFSDLESLKLSSQIAKALTKSGATFTLPCFNLLKQLELCNTICDKVTLTKLLEAMPSLESLSVYVYQYNSQWNDYFEGPESLPTGIASRLKVVKLLGFGGLAGQFHLAFSVLKNAENLEELFVSVCYRPLMPKIEIRRQLLTFPKSLTRALIVVTGPRNSKQP